MKKEYILGLLLGAIIFFILSCEKELLEGDHWYDVSGAVYDSITGLPIDSAKISVNHLASATHRFTDSLGRYSIPGVSSIIYIAQKSGYKNDTIEIYVASDTTGVDFYLVK